MPRSCENCLTYQRRIISMNQRNRSCENCLTYQRRIISMNQRNSQFAQELVKKKMENAELQKTIDFQGEHNFNLRLNRNKIINTIPRLNCCCKLVIEKFQEICEVYAKILNFSDILSAAVQGTENNNNNEVIKYPLITVTNASTYKKRNNSSGYGSGDNTTKWNQSLNTIEEEDMLGVSKINRNSSRKKTKRERLSSPRKTVDKKIESSASGEINLSVPARILHTSTPRKSMGEKIESSASEKSNLSVPERPLHTSTPRKSKEKKIEASATEVQNTLSQIEEQKQPIHTSTPRKSLEKKIEPSSSKKISLTEVHNTLSDVEEPKKVSLDIDAQITNLCRRRLSQIARLSSPSRVRESRSMNSISVERPRRAAAPSSLKEPDLIRKMRRPK